MKFKEDDIEDMDLINGEFKINGTKERIVKFGHKSAISMPSCSCPDWEKFHLPCKHFFAIFWLKPTWTWNKLPKSYLESAYLCLDNNALQDYYKETLSNPSSENPNDEILIEEIEEEIPRKKV